MGIAEWQLRQICHRVIDTIISQPFARSRQHSRRKIKAGNLGVGLSMAEQEPCIPAIPAARIQDTLAPSHVECARPE
jgi:hypothetical protein